MKLSKSLFNASLIVLTTLFSASIAFSQDWYNIDWQYRKAITVNSSHVDANLTDFPLLIDVTDTELDSGVQPDGDDILFTSDDGTTKLAHEIESYSAGDLVAWVRVPSLSSTTDTTVYIYYGNSGAANQENAAGVWDGNYAMVQHLEETSGTHNDSTSNSNNGTPQGGITQGIAGKIDKADDFDGTDDWISFSSSVVPASGSFTLSAWVQCDDVVDNSILSTRYGGIAESKGVDFWTLSGNLSVRIYNNGGTYSPTYPVSLSTWYYVATVYDGANIGLYVDGVFQGENAGNYSGTGANTLGIGLFRSTDSKFFDGIIDEVRISATERSAEWIDAEYKNQNNPGTFYGVGTEENPPSNTAPVISNPVPVNGVTGVGLNPTLYADIDDPQGDSVDWEIWTDASGSWLMIASGNLPSGVGTVSATTTDMDSYFTTYNWRVEATDSEYTPSQDYSLSTAQLDTFDPFNEGWSYSKEITIDAAMVDDDLTNFPVLIDITDADLQARALTDGADIVFMDAAGVANILDFERELYDASTGHLVVWVEVPNLSSTVDTTLYLYYGKALAPNSEDVEGTWESDYVMVHHLEETTGTHYDSTSNSYDGSPQNGVDQNIDGKIGKANEFDGTDDSITISSLNRSSDSQGTVESWVKLDQVDSDMVMLQYYVDGTHRCKLVYDWSHTLRMRFNLRLDTGWEVEIDGDNAISTATWYHVAITQNGVTSTLYVNGVAQSTTDSGEWFDDLGPGTGYIGVSTTGTSWPGYLDGIIDEVRISSSARSAEWLTTQYNNQNDPGSFYTVGTEVNAGAPVITAPNPADEATDVSVGLTQLSFTIEDPNGDSMDYTVTTNPDIGSDTVTSVTDGTYTVSVSGLQELQTYSWAVAVTDGSNPTSETFSFTTEQASPSISNPSPPDNATNVILNPPLSATISDPQSDPVDWEIWTDASGSWQMIDGGTLPTGSGTAQANPTNMDQYKTVYNWRVVADDGIIAVQQNYSFTTEGQAPVISSPDPPDAATDVALNPELSVAVGDADGDLVDITFSTYSSLEREDTAPNSESYAEGWTKFAGNPIEQYTGDLSTAPKNTLNTPVVIPIEGLSYKDYDYAFMHLDYDGGGNYLAIEFATYENFLSDNWTEDGDMPKFYLSAGYITEPMEALIVDGRVYVWGHKDSNGPYEQQTIEVMSSDNWTDWTTPQVAFDQDDSWNTARTRALTIKKNGNADEYLAFYAGENSSGVFEIGKATATLAQLKNNNWTDDLSNPVLTAADVSWNGNASIHYPSLLPKLPDGSWLMAMVCYYPASSNTAIGLVTSNDDGASWQEFEPGNNPIIVYGSIGQWDDRYASTPYFMEMGSRSYRIYYGARPSSYNVYYAIGAAYMGQSTGFEYADVVFNRQIGWASFTLTNTDINNSGLYTDDLTDELIQTESGGVYLTSEVVTPVVDLGEERYLAGGSAGTRIFAQNIAGTTIEIRGSNTAPTTTRNVEWRKGHGWYSGWGSTTPDSYVTKSYSPGDKVGEYYLEMGENYRYVQMRITNNNNTEQLVIDQILFTSVGEWEEIGNYASVGNGTYSATPTTMGEYNSEYYWRVTATDGVKSSEELYSFQTMQECTINEDCSFCEKCEAGACVLQVDEDLKDDCSLCEKCDSGICISQTSSEDVKDECTDQDCTTGFCDGADACGVDSPGTSCTDDGNTCTDDECDGVGVCLHPNNTAPCDDGDVCTHTDTCGGGSCAGFAYSCDDSNVCTDDTCNGDGSCSYGDNTAPCDDGDVCTHTDTCGGGSCAGTAYSCDDSNVCTDDTCNGDGSCSYANNTAPCSDGMFCTGTDTCSGGSCSQHAGDPCTPPEVCDEGSDLCVTMEPGGWWNSEWLYRKEITIDPANVDDDLTDFPGLIDLTDADVAIHAQANGEDLVFTDYNGSKLSHEIEFYDDGTGALIAWVNVPTVSSTEDTVLYMYFGNDLASDQQDPDGTWDSNHVMVQHLEEASGDHYDSTLYANDGTTVVVTDQDATGSLNGADEFNGTGDYVRLPDASSLQFGEGSFTAEAWIYPHSVPDTTGARIVNNRGTGIGGDFAGWHLKIKNQTGRWLFGDSGIDDATDNYMSYNGTTPYDYNQWYQVVMVYEADNELRLYVNGTPDGAPLPVGPYGSINNSLPTAIGGSIAHDGVEEADNKQFFDGIIDEVRLSDTVRSAEWISASYSNQSDPGSFYDLGDLELSTGPPMVSDPNPPDGATNVSTALTELSFTLEDPDGDPMDYTVTTSPDIGSDSVIGVTDGAYSVAVSGLDYETTYQWDISVDDGSEVTNQTYSFTTEKAPGVWWDGAWTYRKAILLDHTEVAEDLYNFPVLIEVDDGSLLSYAQDDADDIVFTDYDGTKLNHEVESYDPVTGALVAWVSVPFLSSTEDTQLYLYYGNSEAPNQENAPAVWDSNYVMVQHLDEVSGAHEDSTINDNDGTAYNLASQDATGKIDGADEFDATGDLIDVGTNTSLNVFGSAQDFSIFVWAKRDATTEVEGFFSAGSNGFNGIFFGSSFENEDDLKFMSPNSTVEIESTTGAIGDTEWHHVGVTADRDGNLTFWVDGGVVHAESIAGSLTENWNRTDDTYKIGTDRSETNPLDGIIDEVRVSDIVRGAGWIQTSYTNQNDPGGFYLLGGVEAQTCTTDDDCGLCEKCEDQACVLQAAGEDTKEDCSDLECGSGTCDGSGNCGIETAGTECRATAGACDVAETCDGTSPDCPADTYLTGNVCRTAAGDCDVAETCSGGAPDCPADTYLSGNLCRTAAGDCDVAETCSGSAPDCPADTYLSGNLCRIAAGDCDVAETCSGSAPDCPADTYLTGNLCRTAAGDCDVAETCSGSAPDCPADTYLSGTMCRTAAGDCDAAEICSGSAPDCPADGYLSGSVCRASVGACDISEFCPGTSPLCPADQFEPGSTVCRVASGLCDISEFCPGSSPLCPADQFEPDTVLCRPSTGDCDAAENCSGGSADCPDDGSEPDGTLCNDQLYCTQEDTCLNGQCIGNHDPCIDNDEYCDGVEYCRESGDTYSCSSTGDPCDPLACNESFDECEESDVILTITDAFGYAGTIDIEAKNCCNLLSSIEVAVCNIDQRPWLHIATDSCSTAGTRTSGFDCTISDPGNGCVVVDITTAGSDLIIPGNDAIARLNYTLDTSAPQGAYADLNPENIVIEDDSIPAVPLTVTPEPGRIQALADDSDGDSLPDHFDNCPDTPNASGLGTCLETHYVGVIKAFKDMGITCTSEEECGGDGGVEIVCDNYQLDCNENGIGDACEPDADGDLICDDDDNCPLTPNGPEGGTCISGNMGNPCMSDGDCGAGGICSMAHEDNYPPDGGNGIGDACECEGDFDCDGDSDGSDASKFKEDFGRSTYSNPCNNEPACLGDFDCDEDCDGSDAIKFKEDFGRSSYSNLCPACEVGEWCRY